MQRTYWYLLVFLTNACSVESQQDFIPQNTFRLNISIAKENKTSTRTASYNDNYIGEIDVVIFKCQGRGDLEQFHSWLPIDNSVITDDPVRGKRFLIQIPSELLVNKYGARIMVLANARSRLAKFIEEENIDETTDRQVFHERFCTDYIYPYTGFEPMPMCGFLSFRIYASGSEEIQSFSVQLFRMFANIDVARDFNNNYSSLRSNFTIQKVYVVGHHSRACIMQHFDDKPTSEYTKTPNVPVNSIRQSVINHTYDYVEAEGEYIMTKTIYVPDSKPYTNDEDYQVHIIDESGDRGIISVGKGDTSIQLNGLFLILECTYKGVQKCYYRVDFRTRYGDYMPILRNYNYVVNITNVRDYGHDNLLTPHYYLPFSANGRSTSGIDYEIIIQ